MTDLKVYKNGKLVPKHKRQEVIDKAHKDREHPWGVLGKPENVNPNTVNENPKFTKMGGLYKRTVTRYGDPK